MTAAHDDPHFVCSQGARNCSGCFTTCDEDFPCPCCGGDQDDAEFAGYFVRCSRCNQAVLSDHGSIVFAPRPGSDLMSGTFVCDDCEADA